MASIAQKFIVDGLETVDTLLDGIPSWERAGDGRRHWYRYGGWGCRLGLATWSARLDERWQTGHWV